MFLIIVTSEKPLVLQILGRCLIWWVDTPKTIILYNQKCPWNANEKVLIALMSRSVQNTCLKYFFENMCLPCHWYLTFIPLGIFFLFPLNQLCFTAGTSRSHWTSSWASSQKSSSWPASLAIWSCWSSTSGPPTMPKPPKTLPACSSTSSTCVSSTITTPQISLSTWDRCSLHSPPLPLPPPPPPLALLVGECLFS